MAKHMPAFQIYYNPYYNDHNLRFFFSLSLEIEGREFSWITGFYWALTVMTTLGFGDITFTHDIGRIFSIVVLLSGILTIHRHT